MFLNKFFSLLILLLLFSGNLLKAQNAKSVDLQALIKTALQQNPQLKAYEKLLKANQAGISVAGALPDPTLGINLLNVPWNNPVFNQEAMSGKQISLSQKFPFFGKLDLHKKIARKEAEIAQANYNEFRNRLIRDVKTAYYDLFFIDQAIRTTQKNQELLNQFVQIATAKYAVGKGLQQDVLKAQVELAKQSDLLLNWQQKREVTVARLNRLLNRPAESKIGQTVLADVNRLRQLKDQWLKNRSFSQRPLLIGWQQRLEQSKESLRLAQKNYWPDFTVSLAYTQRDILNNGKGGTDFVSVGLRFNLPLYAHSKQSKQIEARLFRKQFAESNLINARNQVAEAWVSALSALKTNLDQEELYRLSIIPQAKQALESARAGYQNDKVDFLTLLNNEITLFKIELAYQKIVSSAFKSIAELEFVLGQPLDKNSTEEK